EVLAARPARLLAAPLTTALLVRHPAVGVAPVTRRPNVRYDGPVALLDELHVVPHLRGRGIGGSLMRRPLADAVEEGVSPVEINVDEGDTDARRFHARHGFTDIEPDSGDRALYLHREIGD
ncbi:GNAT family N-acetyltransferase, partial [Streptomyces calidiresistens]